MEPGDFVEPEIAVTAAVTAALLSPRARKVIRKGLVYGMAGILTASDTIASFTKSVGQGMQQASASMARDEQTSKGEGKHLADEPMVSNDQTNKEVGATQ